MQTFFFFWVLWHNVYGRIKRTCKFCLFAFLSGIWSFTLFSYLHHMLLSASFFFSFFSLFFISLFLVHFLVSWFLFFFFFFFSISFTFLLFLLIFTYFFSPPFIFSSSFFFFLYDFSHSLLPFISPPLLSLSPLPPFCSLNFLFTLQVQINTIKVLLTSHLKWQLSNVFSTPLHPWGMTWWIYKNWPLLILNSFHWISCQQGFPLLRRKERNVSVV